MNDLLPSSASMAGNPFVNVPEQGWAIPGHVELQLARPAGVEEPDWYGSGRADVSLWPALYWCSTVERRPRAVVAGRDGYADALRAFHLIETPEAVLAFAQQWGVLRLSADRPWVPAIQDPASTTELVGARWIGGGPGQRSPLQGWEPIEVWLTRARQARRILTFAHRLKAGDIPTRADANLMLNPSLPDDAAEDSLASDGPVAAQLALYSAVNWWLKDSHARPRLMLDSGRTVVAIGGPGLFGALGIELLYVLTGVRATNMCSSCGRIYPPKRLIRQRENFCPACGVAAANKRARERQRAGTAKPRKPRQVEG